MSLRSFGGAIAFDDVAAEVGPSTGQVNFAVGGSVACSSSLSCLDTEEQ